MFLFICHRYRWTAISSRWLTSRWFLSVFSFWWKVNLECSLSFSLTDAGILPSTSRNVCFCYTDTGPSLIIQHPWFQSFLPCYPFCRAKRGHCLRGGGDTDDGQQSRPRKWDMGMDLTAPAGPRGQIRPIDRRGGLTRPRCHIFGGSSGWGFQVRSRDFIRIKGGAEPLACWTIGGGSAVSFLNTLEKSNVISHHNQDVNWVLTWTQDELARFWFWMFFFSSLVENLLLWMFIKSNIYAFIIFRDVVWFHYFSFLHVPYF